MDKQSLINKAWVDLKGDLSNAGNGKLFSGLYLKYNDDPTNKEYLGYFCSRVDDSKFSNLICTVDEFNAYCEKMKQGNAEKPVFTQEMADAGELPPVGCVCLVKHKDADETWAQPDYGEKVIVAYGKELIIFANKHGHETVGHIKDYLFKPLATTKELLIDELASAIDDFWSSSTAPSLAEELYSIGFRKLSGEELAKYDAKHY